MPSRSLCLFGRLASTIAVAGSLAADPAFAVEDVTVDAEYTASLSGFPIANGSLQFKLHGQTYEARLNAQVSGLASLIANRSATGSATGRAEPNHISPET